MTGSREPPDPRSGRAPTRRQFLRSLAAFGGALLAACTGRPAGRGLASPPGPTARPRVRPTTAETIDTRWPIKRVVYIIKENRSFDHLFGRFPGVEGTTVADDAGRERPMTPAIQRLPHDLAHGYKAGIGCWNRGRMDGFTVNEWSDRYAYTQVQGPEQMPNYWHWAREFALADRFFASVHGPSFPNHLYAIAAQGGRSRGNPYRPPGSNIRSWGCDAPDEVWVERVNGDGTVERVPPCFDFNTLGDELTKAGIDWGYYAAEPDQKGYIWSAYSAIHHIRMTDEWSRRVFPVDRLVADARAGRLPPVTWVTPRFELSEHPEYNFCHGENWTTEVVNAIMEGPAWQDTAIFITWDEWGGFYDHVPPPQVDGFGFGIRVPLLVISPYAKRGFVDHEVGEFSSVLRFIEDNWGIEPLTDRDGKAYNHEDAFDFGQKPRAPDPRPLRTDCEGDAFSPPPPGAYA